MMNTPVYSTLATCSSLSVVCCEEEGLTTYIQYMYIYQSSVNSTNVFVPYIL